MHCRLHNFKQLARQLQTVSYSSLCLNQHVLPYYSCSPETPSGFYNNSQTKRGMATEVYTNRLTSLAKMQKVIQANGYKPWVPHLWIVPYTLGIQTTNVTCCINLL